ncbi:MAG TPA: contact-dependent growth inhibition system immunity protein [Chitinophagaceae bacterium]|nr:contact-dependent growth inhibition system immunity protein [Chitinophagaceae bacterium]
MTLENLEKDYWPEPKEFPTSMVKEIYSLRKKEIDNFDPDNFRLLISQGVGLKFLIPKAIELLRNDLLTEALYYPGDLLLSLLRAKKEYWVDNIEQYHHFKEILLESEKDIYKSDNITTEIKEEISLTIKNFLSAYE